MRKILVRLTKNQLENTTKISQLWIKKYLRLRLFLLLLKKL